MKKQQLSLRWVDAKVELPKHDKKVHAEWQGFYDEHHASLTRDEIEEKLRDESIEGVQWLEETEPYASPDPIPTEELNPLSHEQTK